MAQPKAPSYAMNEAELRTRAKRGEAESQYWLGMQLSLGAWGARNELEAAQWMDQAAAQTFLPACRVMAKLSTPGVLPPARKLFVIGCLDKASARGDALCQTALAALLADSTLPSARDKAISHLEKAIKSGYAPALVQQANWMRTGFGGYQADDLKAAESYLKAVQIGSYEAAAGLASLYLKGGAIKADARKAELWLRHAAYSGAPQYLATLSTLLAYHPVLLMRRPDEALILAQEAEATLGSEAPPDILFALACALQVNGQSDEALLQLRSVRRILQTGEKTSEVDFSTLANAEKAWTAKRPWAPTLLTPKAGGKPLTGEIIHPGSPFLRRWIKPAAQSLDDPMPVRGMMKPPPLEQPSWTGREPILTDEWGAQKVFLPTLIPAEQMQLFGFAQEGEDLLQRAQAGDSAAAHDLALRMIYMQDSKAQQGGMNILRHLVSLGHAPSLRALGSLYSHGLGVEKDDTRAFALFQEAGMAGDAEGLFQAARCVEYGLGTSINPQAANVFLRRAIVHGHVGAQDMLAVKLLESQGAESDAATAVKLLHEAAGHGFPESQYRLAYLHSIGKHVPANPQEVVFWATRAARQGHEKAQYILGYHLLEGKGCEKDTSAALKYLLSSAQSPYLPAIRKMAELYKQGTVLPADARRAEAWLRRAAHLGDARDKARLAEFLVIGMEGGNRQPEQAARLLDEALASQKELDDLTQIEFLRATAQVYAGLERWADALDQERAYLNRISRAPYNTSANHEMLRLDSLNRQESYIKATPLSPNAALSSPDARPLPADTILQESDDKVAPPVKPRQEGPTWDIPWGAEV